MQNVLKCTLKNSPSKYLSNLNDNHAAAAANKIIILIIMFHNCIVLTYYIPGTNPGIVHQLTLKNTDEGGTISFILQKNKLRIE